jgi:hypothetical protein
MKNELEQFRETHEGVKDENRVDGVPQVAHEFTQEGSFSCSHLPGNDDEAFLGFDTIA